MKSSPRLLTTIWHTKLRSLKPLLHDLSPNHTLRNYMHLCTFIRRQLYLTC